MTEPVDDQDRQAAIVDALIVEAAAQANYNCAADAVKLLPDSAMINSMEDARRAVDQLAGASPWLLIPEPQEPAGPPPPTPGIPGPHPRWWRRRPNTNEQMLDMLKGGRD